MQMVVEIQAARHKAVTMHGCKIGESKCFILEGGRLMKSESGDNDSAATVSVKY